MTSSPSTNATTSNNNYSSNVGWSICELSGEPLVVIGDAGGSDSGTITNDVVVVTPSGHVCWKRFLALKLSENGGIDPFVVADDPPKPLSLEDCIVLQAPPRTTTTAATVPTAASSTSFRQVLEQVQREYDAVVLELFDTRQVLQSTRKELSQALYQQDAAIRVIARLLQQQQKQQDSTIDYSNENANANNTSVPPLTSQNKKRARNEEEDGDQERTTASKKQTLDSSAMAKAAVSKTTPAWTKPPPTPSIPSIDLERIMAVWKNLSSTRKSIVHEAAKHVIPVFTNSSQSGDGGDSNPFALLPQNNNPYFKYLNALHPEMVIQSVVASKAVGPYQVVVAATTNNNNSNDHKGLSMFLWNDSSDNKDAPQQQQQQPLVVVKLPNEVFASDATTASFMSSLSVFVDLQPDPQHVVIVVSSPLSGGQHQQPPQHVWLGLYHLATNTLISRAVTDLISSVVNQGDNNSSTTTSPPLHLMQVELHPAQDYILFTFHTGLVELCRILLENDEDDNGAPKSVTLLPLSHWQPFSFIDDVSNINTRFHSNVKAAVRSALHPDGLLLAMVLNKCGSQSQTPPTIYLWDVKDHHVAGTLIMPMANDGVAESFISALCFSPNGYQLAVASWEPQQQEKQQQGRNDDVAANNNKNEASAAMPADAVIKICIWDLRKSKLVVSLALSPSLHSNNFPITYLAFDASAKSLAFALSNGMVGVTAFKSKTSLQPDPIVLLPECTNKATVPSSLQWPRPNRIIVTYRHEKQTEETKGGGAVDNNDDSRVICILEATSDAAHT